MLSELAVDCEYPDGSCIYEGSTDKAHQGPYF